MRSAIKAIEMANQKANERGVPHAVVEMDREDGRGIYVVTEQYTHTDEFEAFEGEVIYVTE